MLKAGRGLVDPGEYKDISRMDNHSAENADLLDGTDINTDTPGHSAYFATDNGSLNNGGMNNGSLNGEHEQPTSIYSNDRPQMDPLIHYRIQHVRIGFATTILVIAVSAFYVLTKGHFSVLFAVLMGVTVVAMLGVLAVLYGRRRAFNGLPLKRDEALMDAWSLVDIAIIAIAIAFTGGAESRIYLVYFILLLFLVNSASSLYKRVAFAALAIISYVAVLGATGWHISTPDALERIGLLVIAAGAATALSSEFVKEFQAHRSVLERQLENDRLQVTRFKSMVQQAPEVIITIDKNNRIDGMNARAELMFGYNESQLMGRDISLLIPHFGIASQWDSNTGNDDHVGNGHRPEVYQQDDTGQRLTEGVSSDGRSMTIEVTAGSPIHVRSNTPSARLPARLPQRSSKYPLSSNHTLDMLQSSAHESEEPDESDNQEEVMREIRMVMVRDVTKQKELESEIERSLTHDQLTGLPNRMFLVNYLNSLNGLITGNRSTKLREKVDYTMAIIYIDIDSFKTVNDTKGRDIGDRILKEVAARLEAQVKPGHIISRFDGDEFAVLADDVLDRGSAVGYARHLLHVFDTPFVEDDLTIPLSAHIGIKLVHSGESNEEAISDAAVALYNAKKRSDGRISVFTEDFLATIKDNLSIEYDLRNAVQDRQFFLMYQPIVSLATRETTGFEALVRWNHPTRGIVPPLTFIPLAEQSGSIHELGQWVLEEACMQMAEWHNSFPGASNMSISVNASSQQLASDGIISQVADVLEISGLRSDKLVIEITESSLIWDIDQVVRRLDAMKEMGVRISLDDFGTGYSSLTWLSQLPIDIVKIDKSFVDRIGTQDDAIISAILYVASEFGLAVVAEGIEHEEQSEKLLSMGCKLAQGYLFAKPLPAADARQLATSPH